MFVKLIAVILRTVIEMQLAEQCVAIILITCRENCTKMNVENMDRTAY